MKYEDPFFYEEELEAHQDKRKKVELKKAHYSIFPFYSKDDTYDVLKESQKR